MSPYITFKDTNSKGELMFYVLQRDFPHYVAYLSYFPIEGAINQVPISGHNLFLIFSGTIRGAYIPSYQDTLTEIEYIMAEMSKWFYEHRIVPDVKRYKKWAIPTS